MNLIPKFENFEAFSAHGEGAANFPVECVNWPDQFPDKPTVCVTAGHDGKEIFLKFDVSEEFTMGLTTENNGPVWTDSCVEFFISFDEAGYYNFEFNCIGTMLLGFRKEREKYVHAGEDVISQIVRTASLGTAPFPELSGGQEWSLTVRIPAAAFFRHDIEDLTGVDARANFYKCGDDLSRPHFLSWQPIVNHKPDFHKEEFFAGILFGR